MWWTRSPRSFLISVLPVLSVVPFSADGAWWFRLHSPAPAEKLAGSRSPVCLAHRVAVRYVQSRFTQRDPLSTIRTESTNKFASGAFLEFALLYRDDAWSQIRYHPTIEFVAVR